MGLDVSLLRNSFALVLERAPDVTHRFYDVLFDRHPEARGLFSHNARNKQEEMLARALVSVMERLEDAPWLETQLAALGAKHVEYGVEPHMYAWVGDALLATLATAAGAEWTDLHAREWGRAYETIVALMRRGEPKPR